MIDGYTYDELIAMETLQNFDPMSRINFLSIIIEKAREIKHLTGLNQAVKFIRQEQVENLAPDLLVIFHFNAGNAYSYILHLQHRDLPQGFNELNTIETEQEIIHLRKSYALLSFTRSKLLKAQVCTNLGNILGQVGRFVEALDYWTHALQFKPSFGMASGNLGKSLLHYAHLHYDEGQQYLMGQFAYEYLKRGMRQKGTYPEAIVIFKQHASDIENYYGKKNCTVTADLDKFSNGRSNEEKEYRTWALTNKLFLNPLNDITNRNIANTDTLFLNGLPALTIEPPFAFTMFNQIKQEYVSARYLFFEGIHTDKTHFSDRGNAQMDTLDYSIYGFHTEKMKIAYRLLYSLFDKIAFLLNDYFKLNKNYRKISFRTIWFADSIKGEPHKLHEQFIKTSNLPLRGLYWLSKDLVDKESELTNSLLPEAREIVKTRNFIEHKSFKILLEGSTAQLDNGLTYAIAFDDFYDKTMTLFKMSRAALIYLSLAIYHEEQQRPSNDIVMSMYLPPLDPEDKL